MRAISPTRPFRRTPSGWHSSLVLLRHLRHSRKSISFASRGFVTRSRVPNQEPPDDGLASNGGIRGGCNRRVPSPSFGWARLHVMTLSIRHDDCRTCLWFFIGVEVVLALAWCGLLLQRRLSLSGGFADFCFWALGISIVFLLFVLLWF